jgi:hypothetical protein
MGLGDFAGKVVMRYVADTSQARAELKGLAGEEKKLAEARIKAMEADNKATQKSAQNWQFAAAAVGAAVAAYAVAKSAVDAYGRSSTEAAERVGALEKKFGDATDKIMAGIGEAVMSFEPLLSAIATAIDKLGDLGSVAGKVARGVSFVTGVGAGAQLVNWALSDGDKKKGPASVDKTDYWDPAGASASNFVQGAGKLLQMYAADLGKQLNAQSAQQRQEWNQAHGIYEMDSMDIGAARDKAKAAWLARWEEEKKLANEQTKAAGDALLIRLQNEQDADNNRLGLQSGHDIVQSGSINQFATQPAALDGLMAQQRNLQDGIAKSGREQTFLEGHFGKLSDFDAYAQAFGALTGATTAALDAWIDGSQSAGQAFKHFVGDALKALANQMAIEALKHTAYALGSLAFGDFRGAATHAAAAAAFGVGAAAAAVAAKEVGTSASAKASAGSSGSTPSAPRSSGGSGGGTQQAIIVYGDNFAYDSPRSRERQAQQIVQTATGNSAWSNN